VQKATASNGDVIYRHKDAPSRAVDSKVANDVTLTLEPIAAFSGDALADGRPSAAKTGTEGIETGKHKGGNSDAWMVGYTPQVSTAVWVGSGNATTPIYDSYGTAEYGRDLPGRAWKIFMDSYLSGKPLAKLPTKQLVTAPHTPPTSSVTASRTPTHSNTPSPTFTVTTGFPSSAPPTSQPPTSEPPTTSAPTPTPTPTSCSPGLVLPDCTTPTPTPSGSAPAAP
jgi:membrane peptidoglycan carboxypeptidase